MTRYNWSMTSYNWFELVLGKTSPKPVQRPQKTAKNCKKTVLHGPVRFLGKSQRRWTGSGSGPSIFGQKTGPDRTLKLYFLHTSVSCCHSIMKPYMIII